MAAHRESAGSTGGYDRIADYGGALTGYDALERALQRDGRPGSGTAGRG